MIIRIFDGKYGYESSYTGSEVDTALYRAFNAVVKDDDNEFTGSNTFAGPVDLGGNATVNTPELDDDSTKVANTAFVKAQGYLTEIMAEMINEALGFTPQSTDNLVTTISSLSTDKTYPSAKCVYDAVHANTTAIEANTSAIANNTTAIEANTGSLTALGSTVAANTDAIASIQADYQTTANMVTTINSASTNTKYPTAKAVYNAVNANATAIAANTSAIAANTTAIATNTSAIGDLQTNSQTTANMVTTISNLSTDTTYPSAKAVYNAVHANATAIEANTSAIGDLQTSSQTTANLVTTISSTSTDTTYPSAKCVYKAVSTNTSAIAANTTAIAGVTTLIPSAATASNKLADKEFVNSSVATNTAYFIGTFNSVAELEAYSGTLTNNDYAFVISTDTAGNTIYNRYKYNGTTWLFEYALNNSSFTSDQWAAVNSGITTTAVAQIAANKSNIEANASAIGDLQTNSQTTANMVTTITSASTDATYPSAKAVYNAVNANTTAIAANTSAIAANTSAIGSIQADYQTTANMVTTINNSSTNTKYPSAKAVYNAVNVNTTAILALGSTVADNTSAIGENTTAIAANTSSILALGSTVADNTSSILALSSTVASNTTAITANTSAIATNTTAITANTTAIAANTNSILALGSTVAANTSAIAANTSAIAANTTNIATNTTAISALGSTVASNTSAIGSIQADYQTTANLITTISSLSTDTTYPSAKCVYDIVGNIEAILRGI